MVRNSIFANCDNIFILIILVAVLLLGLVWYFNKTRVEGFETKMKGVIVQPTILEGGQTIGTFYTLPDEPKNKMYQIGDENMTTMTSMILNWALLKDEMSGVEILTKTDNTKYYRLLTGYDKKTIDFKSNNYKDITSVTTYIYPKEKKDYRDTKGLYHVYLNKEVSLKNVERFATREDATIKTKYIYYDDDFTNINSVPEFIDMIIKDCDGSCNSLQINIPGGITDLGKPALVFVEYFNKKFTDDEIKIANYNVGRSFMRLYLVKKDPTEIKVQSAIEKPNACMNITLETKNVGEECLAQIWKEQKCDNEVPGYDNRMKGLSFKELKDEINTTNCYRQKVKTEEPPKVETSVKPQMAVVPTSQPSVKPKNIELKKVEEVKKVEKVNKEEAPFDRSKYILKTELRPSNIPKYNKEDTMNYDNKTGKMEQGDNKEKSSLMSVFKLNL